jgi:hypothetical protein
LNKLLDQRAWWIERGREGGVWWIERGREGGVRGYGEDGVKGHT